jgi:hypothetical protein
MPAHVDELLKGSSESWFRTDSNADDDVGGESDSQRPFLSILRNNSDSSLEEYAAMPTSSGEDHKKEQSHLVKKPVRRMFSESEVDKLIERDTENDQKSDRDETSDRVPFYVENDANASGTGLSLNYNNTSINNGIYLNNNNLNNSSPRSSTNVTVASASDLLELLMQSASFSTSTSIDREPLWLARSAHQNFAKEFMRGFGAQGDKNQPEPPAQVCICVCVYVCMYVSMYVCTWYMYQNDKNQHTYVCIYIYIYTYIHTYTHTHTYIHTHRCCARAHASKACWPSPWAAGTCTQQTEAKTVV